MLLTYQIDDLKKLADVPHPLRLDSLVIDTEQNSARAIRCFASDDIIFCGHFPGHPILPGVLQIAFMIQTAKYFLRAIKQKEEKTVVCAIKNLKFRQPIVPGNKIEINVRPSNDSADGKTNFHGEIMVDEQMASSGEFTLGNSYPEPALSPSVDFKCQQDYHDSQSIMALIPQRPPFLLIDGFLEAEDPCLVYGFKDTLDDQSSMPKIWNQEFPVWFQLESAAQLCCAHLLTKPDLAGKTGIFASIDQATFYRQVAANQRLDIMISSKYGSRLGVATAQMFVHRKKIADASFKFFIADKL